LVTIDVIENTAHFCGFRAEWSRFLEATVPETPFQRPEWLMTWWSHFGSGSLRVLVFRECERIVGVLPCFVHRWNERRQLTLIGSGLSDYLDPVFDPRYCSEIVDVLERHLASFPDWEICDWQDLSSSTPLQRLGPVFVDTPCSQLAFENSFETYFAKRPKDLRRNLRRYREKAQQIGTIRFEVGANSDPILLDALIELHGARWRRSGEPGVIESNRAAGFLRDVAAAFAPRDLLRIFALHFNERIVAVVLAFRSSTTLFSYLSAFDPEYETFGFGRELLAEAIRYAHENGYRYWNFLRGEESYKFSWGAQPFSKCRLMLNRSDMHIRQPHVTSGETNPLLNA